jgi:hypothetical protein
MATLPVLSSYAPGLRPEFRESHAERRFAEVERRRPCARSLGEEYAGDEEGALMVDDAADRRVRVDARVAAHASAAICAIERAVCAADASAHVAEPLWDRQAVARGVGIERSGDCYRGQPAEPEGRLNSSAFRPVLLGWVVFGFFALWLSPRQQAKRLLASKSQAELECRYS